jgi:tetratricopeptide (TPR) repeat protein
MKEKFLLIFVIFCSISCEPTQDFKGEYIPEKKYVFSLLEAQKSQNQKVIAFLNQIIEEGSPAHLYYLRAKYLYESRQYKKANIDIQRSIKSSPRDFDYLLLAGQIALNLENYTTALNYFNLIKSNQKNHSQIFFLLAEVSLKLSNYKLAIYYLNQIRKNDLSQKDLLYHTLLSNLCLTIQIPKINLIKSLDAQSIQDNRLQRIYFEYAMDYTSKYEYQNQLLKVINDFPNDPHLLRFWARFLSKINQFKMAELNYLKVLNLFEQNDNLFLEIGKFYMFHRNYSVALIYLNKIKPDLEYFIDVPFLKSKCYLYLGDNLHSKSMMDSVKLFLKNDNRFYQLKTKHFGISVDSNLVVKDSLLTIRP